MTNIINKPDSWIEINVSDMIQKISTNRKKIKQKEYLENGSLPIIDQGSNYIGGYTNDLSKRIVCDLPVIVFGDHTKVIKFINFHFAPGADGVKVIKPLSFYNPKLFEFFLKVLINKIPDKGYARHFQHIEKITIPLPPLPEQHQIVAKIEELFSELDNGIENLKKAREQLKTYRQAVLKYAFEGKLTKEWRTQQIQAGNPPEPAKKLLEQIKTEREKHYQNQVEDWKKVCEQARTEGKKKAVKPKKPMELPPLTEKELAELPELPEGWGWFRLLQICDEITDGDHQPPPKSPSGIPFITISNIQSNQIDFSNTFFVNENYYSNLKDSRRPKIGDVLYTVTGSYGIPVLINFQQKFCFQRHIGLIRPYKKILNRYAFYLLQSNEVYQQAKKVATGTAQKTVSLEGLRNFKIPLSSIPEQQAIVSEIETRLSVCDKIEQTIEDSLKKAEALRQSILKKAFAGELTRDWREKHPELVTGENSADKLLERIKAEKAVSAAGQKRQRSRKTKKK